MAHGRIRVLVTFICLSGCVAVHPEETPRFANALAVEVVPNDQAQMFAIAIQNTSAEEICVEAAVLPNDLGLWVGESGRYVLQLPETNLHPPLGMEGDCVGSSCEIHLNPGRTIHVNLAYRIFEEPEQIASSNYKRLVVNIPYYRC